MISEMETSETNLGGGGGSFTKLTVSAYATGPTKESSGSETEANYTTGGAPFGAMSHELDARSDRSDGSDRGSTGSTEDDEKAFTTDDSASDTTVADGSSPALPAREAPGLDRQGRDPFEGQEAASARSSSPTDSTTSSSTSASRSPSPPTLPSASGHGGHGAPPPPPPPGPPPPPSADRSLPKGGSQHPHIAPIADPRIGIGIGVGAAVGSENDASRAAGESDDPKPAEFVIEVRKRRRMSSEERLQRSRERNRVHAKKTRQRKKMMMEALSSRIEDLKSEFGKLRQIVDERYTAYILLVMAGANEKGDGASMPGGSATDAAATGSKLASASLAEILGKDHTHAEEDIDPDEAPQKRTRRRGKYTPAEREHIRRERNRMHAKRTRDRKKMFLEESQQTISRMEGENVRLREFLKSNNMLEEEASVPVPPPPTLDVDALDAGLDALDEAEAEAEANGDYEYDDDGNGSGNVSEGSGNGSSGSGSSSRSGTTSRESSGNTSSTNEPNAPARSRSPSDSSTSSTGTTASTASTTTSASTVAAPTPAAASGRFVTGAAAGDDSSSPANGNGNGNAEHPVWPHQYRQVSMVLDGTAIRGVPSPAADPNSCPMEVEASH